MTGEGQGSLTMEPWPRGRLEPDEGEGRGLDLLIFFIGEEISERTGEYREGLVELRISSSNSISLFLASSSSLRQVLVEGVTWPDILKL